MIAFILGLNLLGVMSQVRKTDLPDKKAVSLKTFQDMGITEERVRLFFESKRPWAVFFRFSFFAGFLMLISGIAMNLLFLFGRKDIAPEKYLRIDLVPWGIMDVCRAVVIVVFSAYFLAASGHIASRLMYFNIEPNLHMMLNTFFIDVTAMFVIFYFVLLKYREKVSSLGLSFKGFYKNLSSGITAYIFVLPILVVFFIASTLILDAIGYKSPPHPVFDIFFEEKRGGAILFFTVFVSILGPVTEEVFFRGFLYSAVRKRFGILWGVLLSGALFSALHANIAGFLPIMILGALMAFLYEKTGSLVTPIAVHILHNSIIVCFVLFIKEILR